jgi:hypothetical protein
MKRAALALAVLLFPAISRAAQEPCATEASEPPCARPPFVYPDLVRTLVGIGGAPMLPPDDRTANLVLTAEIGGHPLGGALGTGLSISSVLDFKQLWSVVTPGLFAKIDLTYLFLSGLWRIAPPPEFPFRLQLGGRLGLGVSESTRPSADVSYAVPYTLVRPELQNFADLEIPVDALHVYSFVLRGAIDTPVNLSGVYRWSFSTGLNYGWGL